jgi:hypothetical protein
MALSLGKREDGLGQGRRGGLFSTEYVVRAIERMLSSN